MEAIDATVFVRQRGKHELHLEWVLDKESEKQGSRNTEMLRPMSNRDWEWEKGGKEDEVTLRTRLFRVYGKRSP